MMQIYNQIQNSKGRIGTQKDKTEQFLGLTAKMNTLLCFSLYGDSFKGLDSLPY